jgi:hypothetical protein
MSHQCRANITSQATGQRPSPHLVCSEATPPTNPTLHLHIRHHVRGPYIHPRKLVSHILVKPKTYINIVLLIHITLEKKPSPMQDCRQQASAVLEGEKASLT